MQFSAKQIAQIIGATIEGNEDELVNNFSKIEEAKNGDLCFLSNPKYEKYIYSTNASLAIVNNNLQLSQKVVPTLLRVPDAYAAFAKLLQTYEQMMAAMNVKIGIEQPCFIDTSASYGEAVYIGAFAYLGKNVKIGNNVKIYPQVYLGDNVTVDDNTIIYAGVKIYKDCKIGKNNILHAGAVLGSDGFGFAKNATGNFDKIPQLGNVVTQDNVEIGANTAIDRATMGSTLIKAGSKLDNLIQIAHNVVIGENCAIAGQVAIAGSTIVGNDCMIAGQAGLVGHITIANGVKIGGQSGVSKDIVQENSAWFDSPAFEYRNALKSQAVYKNLPKLQNQLNNLEQEIKALKEK